MILSEQTTASGIREAIARLRTAITNRFQLERDRINQSADSEEEKARQLSALNTQEQGELTRLGERGVGQFNSLVNTAQFLLDNASESEFGIRRQNLINAINTFYDERIAFINGLDLSDTDRANMLEVVRIQRNIALEAIPQMHASVTERLEMERELQDEIDDLRDDALKNEQDRLSAIEDLNAQHADRLLDIERDAQREREDLQRDRLRAGEELFRSEARTLEDVLDDLTEKYTGYKRFADLPENFELPGGFNARDFIRQEAEDTTRVSRRRSREDFQRQYGSLSGSYFEEEGRQQILEGLRAGTIQPHQAEPFIGTQAVEGFISEQRAIEDAEIQRTERASDIEAQATATAMAIETALSPLVTLNTTTAETQAATAAMFSPAVETFGTAADTFSEGASMLSNFDTEGLVSAVDKIPEAFAGLDTLDATLTALPNQIEAALSSSFSVLPDLIASAISRSRGLRGAATQSPPIIVVDFGGGAITQLEGQIINRADQGLSELNV